MQIHLCMFTALFQTCMHFPAGPKLTTTSKAIAAPKTYVNDTAIVNGQMASGSTPLMAAITSLNEDLVVILLQHPRCVLYVVTD